MPKNSRVKSDNDLISVSLDVRCQTFALRPSGIAIIYTPRRFYIFVRRTFPFEPIEPAKPSEPDNIPCKFPLIFYSKGLHL